MPKVRYAELAYPGSFFPETTTVKVSQKTTAEELFKERGSKGCYRIDFFTRTEEKRGDDVLVGKSVKEKKHYLYGTGYTIEQLKKLEEDHRILISNCECNGWKGAVRCKPGNWQPWDDNTVIINARVK